MKISAHALNQYSIRTGCLQTVECATRLRKRLASAEEVPVEYAQEMFPIRKVKKGVRYYVWQEPSIGECACAIQCVDGTIATVLTQNIYTSNR